MPESIQDSSQWKKERGLGMNLPLGAKRQIPVISLHDSRALTYFLWPEDYSKVRPKKSFRDQP
jgi:hypothetical protein